MIKDIKYNGYSAQPSDYECPDGDLAASINLISEDSQTRPLAQPSVVLKLQNGENVLLIHHVPNQNNYILERRISSEKSVQILWLKTDDNINDTTIATPLIEVNELLDIAAVGNTLILALSDGLKYILWKDGGYSVLGYRPPFISIDFGLQKEGILSDDDDFTIPARCGAGWGSQRGRASKSELASMTEMVYGLLNQSVADNVTSQGLFYQPFFVRYAYRLYDGSYRWHSAPILMLPAVNPPIVKYTDDGSHPGADGTLTATFRLQVNYFALFYRILADRCSELEDWSDIISGIDIFISAPIYTYDQSKDLRWRPTTSLRNMLLSLIPQTGARDENLPTSVFVGHYSDNYRNNPFEDHLMSTASSDSFDIINIRLHERFHENIRNAHDFYKIAEIDLKNIKAMTSMERLKLIENDLSSLVTRETLPDDYQSHCNIVASSLFTFNSRLNLSGIKIIPAEPFPIRSCMQFGNPDGASSTRVRITVWTRLNGVKSVASRYYNDFESELLYLSDKNQIRYIYYPDTSAYKLEIRISDSQKFIFDLTSHSFLNGAYFYNSDFNPENTLQNALPETSECATSVNAEAKIYTSEVNNPFVFPLTGINTVGSGSVYGVCSAAKALSQGQFGQFPLYAFTSEGVWALETNANGSYSAIQPISRDVCINPESITQIDSAVLFATNRGIMLISGSQTQCISESLCNENPFDILSLPEMEKIHSMLGHNDCSCFPIAPFSDFIKSCGICYDYTHQHIIVFSKKHSYAYVYSLKSKLWGMIFSKIVNTINSYTDALAVDKDFNLVDFSKSQVGNIDSLLVSRPLKLDTPDILKTVDTVIQRGNFRKEHVKSLIYGSRDLMNWHLVWTSKDHYLRGFRGSPYKYFRIALLCNLSADESIYGASLQFSPRLTNRLR